MKEFDKVIGYEEVKFELERLCDIMKHPKKYRDLGVSTPKGLLLQGEPGLGKTLMAKCFIEASGRKAICCRKDKPDGDFVNEIRKAFDEAKASAPSIVFLDDMDKFANEDERHRNAEEFVTIQSCIDDCRDAEVFVLATTNETHCLPNSLLRAGRFDKILDIKAPEYEDAVKIVRFYLNQKKFVSEVDVEEVTKILSGKSCAELETVINEAGIYAGFEGKKSIEMNDIIKACLRVIFHAPEVMSPDKDYLKEVAYHEAGHTVVQEILEPGSINLVSVASYSGDIGGITSYNNNKNYFKDINFMQNRVRCILGGKAATELVFGTTDTGAGHDLHRAYDITERFIDDYCSFDFSMFLRQDSGAEIADRKDVAIGVEMGRFYAETKKILIDNREFLDKLAETLIEKKTLLQKDIAAIRETYFGTSIPGNAA